MRHSVLEFTRRHALVAFLGGLATQPMAAQSQGSIAEAAFLPISPEIQQTPVWCWAAVSTMVLKWFGYPNVNPGGNFQCGFVAVAFPSCDLDCRQCIQPAGPMQNTVEFQRRYVQFVRRYPYAYVNRAFTPDIIELLRELNTLRCT